MSYHGGDRRLQAGGAGYGQHPGGFMSKDSLIHVLDKRLALQQMEGGFRTSIDAVLLAAACPVKEGQSLLDMGCGVGSAGLCVLRRVAGVRLTGVDIQEDHVTLAKKNASVNGFNTVEFLSCDIKEFVPLTRFDHVICNPPYLEAGTHLVSPSAAKAKAMGHLEDTMDIKGWVDAGHRCVKSGGSMTVIHRADQCDKIIRALGKRFGAVEIIPLWPKAGVEAKRVIIRAIKDRKSPARLHPGVVLHQEDGSYTPAANTILRDMGAI